MAAIAEPAEAPVIKPPVVDLVSLENEPWCVVAARGRDRNKDNHSITRCGRKLLVTTPGLQRMNDTPLDRERFDDDALCAACVASSSRSSPAPADAFDRLQIELRVIRVTQVRRSPLNHRKTFRGIEELGADIKTNGQKVPVKVRPVDDAKTPFELVYGERRWRAAMHAGVEFLLCIIQELTDKEVIEEQLVENVSRSDVHPLEEADGYHLLLEKHGYTVDQLVEKTGKSRTAIYNRLKLVELPKGARAAFLADKITASVAELIARIPVAKLREQATKEILKGRQADYWEITSPNAVSDDGTANDPPPEGIEVTEEEVVPLSVRETQVLIQRHYMLRLELAPFDPADEKLTKAGGCTKCVHRTGNQANLFGDVASADVCTNPPCFDEKKKADWDARAAKAKDEGKRILTPTEADTVFQGDRLTYNAPYIDLKGDADWEFQKKGARTREKTWGEVLGKHAPTVVLARDGAGAAHELVDKREAMASLKDAGKLPAAVVEREKYSAPASNDKKAREKRDIQRRTAELAISELAADNFAGYKPTLWLAECVIRLGTQDAHEATCRRRSLEPKKGKQYIGPRKGRELALLEYARDLSEVEELNGLIRELLAWEPNQHGGGGHGDNLTSAAKVFGFDLSKLQKKLEAEAKAKKVEKPGKPKKPTVTDDGKRCGLVHGKNGDACIHELGHDGVHSTGKLTWSERKKKGAKSKHERKIVVW